MSLHEQVITWLNEQDLEAYLVGGCVRDRLLGYRLYDLDVATPHDGLALARRLADHFCGDYYALDRERGTGRAILQSEEGHRLIVDVARYRGSDLLADLADRDFTVNALAVDVHAPYRVIDHHGGLADLEAGLIRPVSDGSIRTDPVRALRAVRQALQLGFSLTAEVESLIRRDGAAIAQVSGERIRDELARLLALARAAPGLCTLDELGLLTAILPELEPLRDLAQPPPHHLDALRHTLETVRALEDLLAGQAATGEADRGSTGSRCTDALVADALSPYRERLHAHLSQIMSDVRPRLVTLKMAALLHDTGKPEARSVDAGGRIRFLGHQQRGTEIGGQELRRLRFSRAEVRLGETIIRHHMQPLLLTREKSVTSRAVYRFYRAVGGAGVDIVLHVLADHCATYSAAAEDPHWPQLVTLAARMLGDYWERQTERVEPPPLVNGHDLMREFGLQAGPQVGRLLEMVREAQVSGLVDSREGAISFVAARLASGDRLEAGEDAADGEASSLTAEQ